ncbi:RNA recognition motif domain-containing protein [Endothiovibrio diazotrophicus]
MKIDYCFAKGVVVTAALAGVGYGLYPLLAASGLEARGLFALAVAGGSLIGGVLASIRLPAGAAVPAAASAPAGRGAESGERKTVFVGNLAYRASQEEVRDLFRDFGEVYSVRLMTDRVTRRPRGFGFVEMDAANAEQAIRGLDGRDFMGRELKVNEGKQRESRMNQAA